MFFSPCPVCLAPKVDVEVPFLNNVKFGCFDGGCSSLKKGNRFLFGVICSVFTAACQG